MYYWVAPVNQKIIGYGRHGRRQNIEPNIFESKYQNIYDEALQRIFNDGNETTKQPKKLEPQVEDGSANNGDSDFEGLENCNLRLSGEPTTVTEIIQF